MKVLKLSPGSAHDSYTKIDSPTVYKPIVYTPEGKHSGQKKWKKRMTYSTRSMRWRRGSYNKWYASSGLRTIQRKKVLRIVPNPLNSVLFADSDVSRLPVSQEIYYVHP